MGARPLSAGMLAPRLERSGGFSQAVPRPAQGVSPGGSAADMDPQISILSNESRGPEQEPPQTLKQHKSDTAQRVGGARARARR
eukprot:8110003-Pyramimonas_sp.AAC.1